MSFNVVAISFLAYTFAHPLLYFRKRPTKMAERISPAMMLFTMFLPDWNSLDSIRRTHSDLEGTALVFFALLVVAEALSHLSDNEKRKHLFDTIGIVFFAIAVLAEIAAYPYGQRNDTLSEEIIGSLDQKAKDASTKASLALKDSSAAEIKAETAKEASASAAAKSDIVSKRADALDKEEDAIEKRVRSQSNRADLLIVGPGRTEKSLLPYKGQAYSLEYCSKMANDPENFLGRTNLVYMLDWESKWYSNPQQIVTDECQIGVLVETALGAPDSVTHAAKALVKHLNELGVATGFRPAEVKMPRFSPSGIVVVFGVHP